MLRPFNLTVRTIGAVVLALSGAAPCGVADVPASAAAGKASKMAMHLAPADGKPLSAAAPVTFGVVFRPGEIPAGKRAVARLDGRAAAAQVDAKRHFADGSLKHAIVSMVLPSLRAEGVALTFASADPPAAGDPKAAVAAAAKLLAGDFDAVASFQVPEGKTVSASARKMLQAAGEKAALWLNGPVAVEWLLSGAPVDEQGNADADLNVQFQVRYYPATGNVRVSAVVELCGDGGSDGGLIYDVTVTAGRARPQVFEQKDVHQPDLTRWRKVFWAGAEPPAVTVRHDARAMAAAGVMPQYDLALQIAPGVVDGLVKRWQAARTGLFENGLITPYMPMTGGRWDLGVLPFWTVVYLQTMDGRVKPRRAGVLDNDDLSGGIPIHARLRQTGRVPFYKGNEMLWLADPGAPGGGPVGHAEVACQAQSAADCHAGQEHLLAGSGPSALAVLRVLRGHG